MANKRYSSQQPLKEIDWNRINATIEKNSQRRKAENAAKEAQWEQERRAREAQKKTEQAQREAAELAKKQAAERQKIEKATTAFNNEQQRKANVRAQGRAAQERAREKRESQRIPYLTEKYTARNTDRNSTNYGYAYQSERLTDEGKMQKWSDPNYKLSKDEVKEAKSLLKQEQKRRNALIKSGNQDIMINGTAENARYKRAMSLDAKVNNAFGYGLTTPYVKIAGLAQRGLDKLLNPNDGGDLSKALEMQREQISNAYALNDAARTQSPVKNLAGTLIGQGAMYAATNPLFDAGAEALGASSVAGRIAVNQLGQNAQDLALDTLPTYLENLDRGMSEEQARSEAVKGIAANAAGNIAMQGLSDFVIPRLGKAIQNANTPKIDMDEFRQGIARLEAANNPQEIPSLSPVNREAQAGLEALTEAAQRQTDEAANVLREAEPLDQFVADNVKSYSDEAIQSALDTNDSIRSVVSSAIEKNADKMNDTARKNADRLNDVLDELDNAIRNGADREAIQQLNKEAERAYGALDKNLQRVGANDLHLKGRSGSTFFGGRSEQNVNNILDSGRVREPLPTDAEGFVDTDALDPSMQDKFEEMFNNQDFRVMPEDTGLTNRRGVSLADSDFIEGEPNVGGFNNDKLIADQRVSRVRANTLQNAGIDDADELKNIIPEEDFQYISQPEKVTYEAAQDSINNDWEGNLAKYTEDYDKKSVDTLRNAQDIDAMMLMRQRINDMARNATDPAEKRQLYAQSRQIALNLRKAGTEAGRNVQAFAKWTRTPEGAITSAQGFAEDLVKKELKNEPKLTDEISRVSRQIEDWLDTMDAEALTREDIEKMITDAIRGRDRLRKRVGKGDIQKLTDAIMNERQYADIQKQLEFLSTGFEDIDAETLDTVQDIFERAQALNYNSKERVDLENEAYKLLATKIAPKGGTFRDKIDAWRYLAMLANPTTHIKNITGNELFGQGMVSAKNTLGAMIEAAADRVSKVTGKGGIDRTKAILTRNDKGLIDAANNDALQNVYRELSGNKYFSTGSAIDSAIPAFNTTTRSGRILNKISDLNSAALNAEDEAAVLAKYRTSLAGFLKANGADESIFNATDKASQELLESGRAYAINQAKEAAFHQDSAVASWLSQASRNARESDSKALKALGFGADVVIPFKKTPINILKSAIEYSPAEYIKVMGDIRKLNRGSIKAADFIDEVSKATTGTAALGIGALLAREGILKIGSSKSDEEQSFDKQTGRQNVAIKAGNKYVAMSELIPAAAPLILGGTIYETLANSKGEDGALNTIFAGMSAITNGVTDMTMLSGIADTLNSVRYAQSNEEVWQKLGLDTASNLASQMLPTLGRKINTTLDDTKRSTYSDKTGAAKTIDQEAKYLQTKIPGLQQAGEAMKQSDIPALQAVGNRLALQPNIDVKGQVQDSPGVFGENGLAGRIANNFLAPVSLTEDSSTAYDDERRRLANETGETKVLPYIASSEAKIGDTQLTPEQWTQYRQQRGQMRESLATEAINSDYYKGASDADKAAMLTNIDAFTKKYTQAQFGGNLDSWNQQLADAYESGGIDSVMNTIAAKNIANASDFSTNTKVAKRISDAVTDGNIRDAEAIAKEAKVITDAGFKPAVADKYLNAKERIPKLTAKEYVSTFKKADENGNGSLTQKEILAAMNADRKNAKNIQNMFWESDSKIPQLVDGEWKAKSTGKSTNSTGKSTTEAPQSKEDRAAWVKQLNSGGGDIDQLVSQAGYKGHVKDTYTAAKQAIPSLTPQDFITSYKYVDANSNGGLTQKEIVAAMNADQQNAQKYQSMFWQNRWKKKPVNVNGSYVLK